MVLHGKIRKRLPVAYFYFNGWDNINLGITVSWSQPNIEIHVPFGFLRFGWVRSWEDKQYYSRSSNSFLVGYEEYRGWTFGKLFE